MKIVIVLCSLATFAIAVPVYQENFIESSLNNQPLSTKRERKSTLPDISPGSSLEHGIEKIPFHSSKKSENFIEAKSFRRPIIIKRKLGYHVYRDSDEEMAHSEPGEKCREQVKFKLCDHEPVLSSKNGIKSPTFKCVENYKTDNEMENSIKMAKEAVEHLQRDLKRMENFSPKMSNPHIEDIESNTAFHHDIEIAREALEHIEQNFESVNLEVNKVNELQTLKSQDEERLTRWREAIENIHKNFEIVKNIEDTFKSDNQYSSLLLDSRKAVELEQPKHTEGHVYVQGKITNDNLENTDDVLNFNEDMISKSASNDVRISQLSPKTESIDNIGKDAATDMFISSTENREETRQLHSDSLKSELNFKDTFEDLISDVSEIESKKDDTTVTKESNEYSPKNSLPEVAEYSEHEKTMIYHINDNHDILPKVSSSLSGSPHKNLKIEEQKGIGKSQLMIKTALSDIENRNPIIKMKSVKEILENKKDHVKVATSNEENINEEVFFKSNNKNSPLERLSAMPKSSITEASENLDDTLLPGGEENKYSNNRNSEGFEDEEKDSKAYNTNMRLSNDQLEKSKQLPFDNFAADREVIESSHLFSLKEKNVFNDEEKGQNEHKNHQVLYDTLKNSEQEFKDESKHFENLFGSSDEYKNMKSSEAASRQSSSRIIQNQELNRNNILHDDLVMTVVQNEPELFKTVSDASNEDILTDRDQSTNQHGIEEQMRMSLAQSKDAYLNQPKESPSWDQEMNNDDHILSSFKTVAEIDNENQFSANDKEKNVNEEPSMRNSQDENELFANLEVTKYKNKDTYNPLYISLDEGNPVDQKLEFSKSVPELYSDPLAFIPKDKLDIDNYEHFFREEPSMRLSESENKKTLLNVNQEAHHPEDDINQFPKSVLEPNYDPMLSMLTDKVENTNDQDPLKEETSMRFSENKNEKIQVIENQEVPQLWPVTLDSEQNPVDRTWQFSKSVPELQSDPMILLATDKVDITNDQNSHKDKSLMRLSQSQNEKLQFNEYEERPDHSSARLDIENHSEDLTHPLFKSVPELQSDPMTSLTTENVDIPNDQYFHKEKESMRSSDNQNEKKQLDEKKEFPESLSLKLDAKLQPEDDTWQIFKSVPALQFDPMVSLPTDKLPITNEQDPHKEESHMRWSQNQNEKLQFNEYEERPEHSSVRLDIESDSEGLTHSLFKSVPELQSEQMTSLATDSDAIQNDQHSHSEEESMRSSKNQNEKMQLDENKKVHEPLKLDAKLHPEDDTWQNFKSVPELQYDPMPSLPTDNVDITNDQHSHREEESMRSSVNQNDKIQLDENKEVHTSLTTKFDAKHHPEEDAWQISKSVPEAQSDLMVAMSTDKVDITEKQHSHSGEASMRLSQTQNEKLQLNEYPPEPEPSSVRLDIKNNQEETTSLLVKSVPELQSDPMVSAPMDEVDITHNSHFHKEEASMRLPQTENEKLLLNEYEEVPEHSSMRLHSENNSEGPTLPLSKSVPEVQSSPMISLPTEKVDITDDQHSHRKEANMRSSESQNEKMQFDVNQEMHETMPMRLNIENDSEGLTPRLFKSVPELQSDTMVSTPTDKVIVPGDQQSLNEASMRLSQIQNEKLKFNENREVHESLSMELENKNRPEEHISQFSKSVSEMQNDLEVAIPKDQVDITNDQHSLKEEATMRLSQTENEKLQLNENQERLDLLPTRLDIENHEEEWTSQFAKSVPQLKSDPMVSTPTDKVVVTGDQHSLKDEESMRLSQSQHEKVLINVNQETQEPLLTRLDSTKHPEDGTWKFLKSVPEPNYDPMLAMLMDKVDNNNEQRSLSEEASMRLSQIQNEKLQLKENQVESELLQTRLNIKNHQEERTSSSSKSVSDLHNDPIVSMLTDNVESTMDKNSLKEVPSRRLSQSQNEELHVSENQEVYHPLTKMLEVENNADEHISQLTKSVPEQHSDSLASMPANIIELTNDQHFLKDEMSMRLSEDHNKNMQLKENQEIHDLLPKSVYEQHPEDRAWHFSKSIPELNSEPMVSMPMGKVDITDDQNSHRDENMRLSQTQNEKFKLNELNQEAHEPLSMRLDNTNHPEEHTSQFFKSVSELYNDPMISLPTDTVEMTNEPRSLKGELNMRLSQNQNQRLGFYENDVHPPTKIDIENLSEVYSKPSDNKDVSNEKQFYKEEAKLSQKQDERQQINLNPNLYEPLSSRLNIEKHLADDSSQVFKTVYDLHSDHMLPTAANKVRFTYEQNPTKEQSVMSLSQNENEMQYSGMNLGLSNEFRDKQDNEENVMDDVMRMNLAQQLHKNYDPMLRMSNEGQYLSQKFKSMPEYKLLNPTLQFEINNGQNTLNEHINRRINQQQRREPEANENQFNSMRWNTENHNQDPLSKTFKSFSNFDHTLYKNNEFDNEPFMTHDVSKMGNIQEFRNRPQSFDDHGHILDNTQSPRWFQTKEHNDNFANYYKIMPEMHEEYMNPHLRKHLHRVAANHRLNDEDAFSSYDFPSSRARLHDHMQKYHQEKSSNIDSSMEQSMHMNMREPFGKSAPELNNIQFNHPHGTARFGAALPIAAASPGAVGVFPTANAGGCGIPLLLSCSPSVISGSLARPHTIAGPAFKSVDDNFKYYIKRNAKNIAVVPAMKVQNAPLPHNYETGKISEI